jgi:disulfide bond formation protein DsbB
MNLNFMRVDMKQKRMFTTKPVQYRSVYGFLFILSVLPLVVAHWLQTALDLAPCPLCVAQRYGFGLLAVFALWGLIKGRLPKWADVLAVLCGGVGASIAVYHLWIIAHPSAECVKDAVEQWLNALPTARWFPEWFSASGSCTAHLPLILGLQIPTWSLMGLAGISLAWLAFALKRR